MHHPPRPRVDRSRSTPDVRFVGHVVREAPPCVMRSSTLPAISEPLDPVHVFLGGSCNPTRWRRDVAIPMLDEAGVSYYNPQVDEWHEGLMDLEAQAKETATMVLFVIDNLTRAIVSINEAAEYMCCGRRVVLVVLDMEDGVHIGNKALTEYEIADLNAARACLRQHVSMYPLVKLFKSLEEAVTYVISEDRLAPLTTNKGNSRVRPNRLRKRSSLVLSQWPKKPLNSKVFMRSCSSSSIIESGSSSEDEGDAESPPTNPAPVKESSQRYIYLGGNLRHTSWRASTAIPMLQKALVPYYSPSGDFLWVANGIEHKSDKNMKHSADLILIVIPNNCRSIASMTDALLLICSERAVLLVIEPMVEGTSMEDGTTPIGREFQDLHRARAYLTETARRHDTHIFDDVASAIDFILTYHH
ncbi:hypothetical protein, variant [Saprolegnia diclina VS20]|uniref:Uncharacterized protein n=1 Tax=Saprolegnia diclina (strain VS20) TaxID=1156394 RepID=T0S8J6_SAPDV|nr:hypothetical protein, variant [Saprolegnia diclina VS20]EQC41598.1 hypothetical protein, variant [Saprolegnia diclina VS20]|eukprot:XP_008605312.1 hypothetical protein, variant [Saprolegnia diclina VS20]